MRCAASSSHATDHAKKRISGTRRHRKTKEPAAAHSPSVEDTDWGELFEDILTIAARDPPMEPPSPIPLVGVEVLTGGERERAHLKVTSIDVVVGRDEKDHEPGPSSSSPHYWDTELPKVAAGHADLFKTVVHECEPMRILVRSRDGRFVVCVTSSAWHTQQKQRAAALRMKKEEDAEEDDDDDDEDDDDGAPHHVLKKMKHSAADLGRENKRKRLVVLERQKVEEEEEVTWRVAYEADIGSFLPEDERGYVTITDPGQPQVVLHAHVTQEGGRGGGHEQPDEEEDDDTLECFRATSAPPPPPQRPSPPGLVIAISIPPATVLILNASSTTVACLTLGENADAGLLMLSGIEAEAVGAYIHMQIQERREDLRAALIRFNLRLAKRQRPCDFTLSYTSGCCALSSPRFPSLLTLSKNIGRPTFSADKGLRRGKSPSLHDDEEMEVPCVSEHPSIHRV